MAQDAHAIADALTQNSLSHETLVKGKKYKKDLMEVTQLSTCFNKAWLPTSTSQKDFTFNLESNLDAHLSQGGYSIR